MRGLKLGMVLAGGLLFGMLTTTSAMQHNEFLLYDDFSTKRLDPSKWFGQQTATDSPGGIETVRRVNRRHGRLVMRHRVEGRGVGESDGDRSISRNRLNLTDHTVTGMQFDTVVKRMELGGCEIEGVATTAGKARGTMFLFNDGARTNSDDATGDIGAVVEVFRTTQFTSDNDQYRIRGFLFRCTDTKCSTNTSEFVSGANLGTLSRKDKVTLGMRWFPETNTVAFWRDGNTPQVLNYEIDDSRPSTRTSRRLEIRVEAANCEAGEASFAEVKAYFDNVLVHR